MNWDEAVTFINKSSHIGIFTHISADGDALGSCFGLALLLKNIGKDVAVILEEKPEARLEFLCDNKIKLYVGIPGADYAPDLSIVLDCGDSGRLGSRMELVKSTQNTIGIDHHLKSEHFTQLGYFNTNWSATCEGIWEFAKAANYQLDNHVALRLFAGIVTDTGGFAYSNTTSSTHLIASNLKSLIGDTSWLFRLLFETITPQSLRFQARVYNMIEYYCDGKIAYINVTQDDFTATGASEEDINGMSNTLRAIKGVDVGVVVKPSKILGLKVSLRSSEFCDVAAVASIFGGGGHKRAAGFNSSEDIKDLKECLISELEKSIINGRNN